MKQTKNTNETYKYTNETNETKYTNEQVYKKM